MFYGGLMILLSYYSYRICRWLTLQINLFPKQNYKKRGDLIRIRFYVQSVLFLIIFFASLGYFPFIIFLDIILFIYWFEALFYMDKMRGLHYHRKPKINNTFHFRKWHDKTGTHLAFGINRNSFWFLFPVVSYLWIQRQIFKFLYYLGIKGYHRQILEHDRLAAEGNLITEKLKRHRLPISVNFINDNDYRFTYFHYTARYHRTPHVLEKMGKTIGPLYAPQNRQVFIQKHRILISK